MPAQTVLFDIDGTLLVTDSAGTVALESVFRDHYALPEPDLSINFSGRTDASILRELLQINGLCDAIDSVRRLRDHYIAGFPAVMRRVGGWLLPGVESLIARCRDDAATHCCVMTGNCVPTAREKLGHFDLVPHFRSVFGGDESFDRIELARRTADAMTGTDLADVDRVVVVGDTPDDVHCGRAIDAKTIAVATGRYDAASLAAAAPDLLVDDLTDERVAEFLFPGSVPNLT